MYNKVLSRVAKAIMRIITPLYLTGRAIFYSPNQRADKRCFLSLEMEQPSSTLHGSMDVLPFHHVFSCCPYLMMSPPSYNSPKTFLSFTLVSS